MNMNFDQKKAEEFKKKLEQDFKGATQKLKERLEQVQRDAQNKQREYAKKAGKPNSGQMPLFNHFKFFNLSAPQDQKKFINYAFLFFFGLVALKIVTGSGRGGGGPGTRNQMETYGMQQPQ